jgi:hypothetical protein
MSEERLIDDLTGPDGRSALGTNWQFFTDRVMGGVSRGSAALDTLQGRACIHLRGQVSLENNGGFVQVALPLGRQGEVLDASEYAGVRLMVRGNGDEYYVHLRTRDTRLPWQYYQARFKAESSWQSVEVPFRAFRAENLDVPLDASQLLRVAIVAAKKEMEADVAVARISLYR